MENVLSGIRVIRKGLSIAYTLSRLPTPGGVAARTNGAMVYEDPLFMGRRNVGLGYVDGSS